MKPLGWSATAFLVAVGILAASGVYLSVEYTPSSIESGSVGAARTVHEITAYVALLLGGALVVTSRRAWHRSGPERAMWLSGAIALIAATGYAIVTGDRLAWDQLALWAVTTDVLSGVWLPGSVKFVVVDGTELSRSAFTRAVWLHVIAVPVVVLLASTAVIVAGRRARRATAESSDSSAAASSESSREPSSLRATEPS